MTNLRFPLSILASLAVLLVAELLYFYPQLPETVASHFDADGVPNGWMSKTTYTILMVFIMIISAAPTVGVALFLPKMESAVNIPNRNYWLAPERREETLGLIASTLIWTECTVIALLVVLTYAVCVMNIEQRPSLDLPMIPTLGIFLGVLGFLVGRMILRFRTGNESATS
ncbi:MAG TPA: DUF1648 domain-containing protein [Bacteroidota bacterium]|nr:DUF1648 domain-containing protein [Bacteroidota bacterium]